MTSSAPGGQSYLLTNDDIIAGSGTIGNGNGKLRLTNLGAINATDFNNPLVINTGSQVVNQGTIGNFSSILTISDPVNNAGGLIQAEGQNLSIGGNVSKGDIEVFDGQVELKGILNDSTVTFENKRLPAPQQNHAPEQLTLDHAETRFSITGISSIHEISGFWGTVVGFYDSDPTPSDTLDLRDIRPGGGFPSNSTFWKFQENADGLSGELTVGNGANTANIALIGQYLAAGMSASSFAVPLTQPSNLFHTASDGHGGTLVTTSFHT
jgi:hypothetical protein